MINKISYKLISGVSAVTISIIAVFSYFIITTQTRELINQVRYNANQLSETIKSSTKHDMLLNQRDRVHRIIETIGQQKGIEKIRIFNKEGEVIYTPNKSEIGSFVDKKGEACFACHAADQALEKLSIPERTRIFKSSDGMKNLGIINPIYNERGCWQADCHAHKSSQKVLGVLDVTMSLDEVERQVNASRRQLMLFALISILSLSLILWFLVRHEVGTPIKELVKATNIVATPNLDYRIKNIKKDEFGYLGKSFNAMTQKLAEANKQIFQSNKLASLGRLAAGVAHEINNPLTGILTYSSFLLKHSDSDTQTKEDLEVIVRETKRCGAIVKRLLEFARQAPASKTLVDINDIIKHAISIVDNQLAISNISLSKKLKENLPEIKADGNQIHQVLINLLVNAADAMNSHGGTISLSTKLLRNETEYVEIKIGDTGCGISKEDLHKIFDPFFTTKGQKGTGLGLAVVWGIIEQHSGTISVESEVSKGTIFTIRLPVGVHKSAPSVKKQTSKKGMRNVSKI